MTALARHPRLRAFGRLVLLITAIALTTWGVCLTAFSDTMRGTRLGIPIAFWGVLLGYTAIRVSGETVPTAEVAVAPSSALEPRASAELVRERDEATRHEYELRLELMLRRELEQVLRTELSGLRRDVAELRGDVLDAVDGRLRMERVEITRIIGSNLAALQDDGRVAVPAAADVALAAPGAGANRRSGREDGPRPSSTAMPTPAATPAATTALAVTALAVTAAAPAPARSVAPRLSAASPALEASYATSAPLPAPTAAAPPAAPVTMPWVASQPSESAAGWSPPGRTGAAGPGVTAPVLSGVRSRRVGSSPVPSTASVPWTASVLNPSPDVEAEPLTESPPTPSRATQPDPHDDPERTASRASDPFASLPRLSAFRLPDLPAGVSLSAPEPVVPEPATINVSAQAPMAPAATNGYVGRRRHAVGTASDDADDDANDDADYASDDERVEPASGRHGAASGTAASPVRTAGSGASGRPVAHRR